MLGAIERVPGYEDFVVTLDAQRRWTPGFPLIGVTAARSG